jgi:HEAT repeat protein
MRPILTIGLGVLLLGTGAGIAQAQSKDPLKDIINLLKDPNKDVRRAASYALITYPENASAIPPLIKVLGDPDREVRENAVLALSLMYPHDVVAPLGTALKDSDPMTRRYAAEALGRVRRFTEGALPNLMLLLKDKDADVRKAARQALRNILGIPPKELTGQRY